MAKPLLTATRASLLALSACLTLPAVAAEKSWTLAGGSLEVSTPCAREIEIIPAASAREIRVDAVADHQEEIDALSVGGNGNGVTVTKQGNRCPLSQRRKQETLRLTISLPAGGDLSVREGGSGAYRVTVPVGNLDLRLSGSGGLAAERVTGRLDASFSGSGGTLIREMAGGSATVRASGSGGARIGGTIDALEIDLTGSGEVDVAAAGGTDIETSGSGSVRAGRVDGPLSFNASGSGGLSVGTVRAGRVEIRTSGNGNTRIRGGSIGSLRITVHGSADARIEAVVETADLSTSGSGNIDIRQVTGPVTRKSSGSGRIRIGD